MLFLAGGAAIGLAFQGSEGGSASPGSNNAPGVATRDSSGGTSLGTSDPVLLGPGANATEQSVSAVVNVDGAELPAGWRPGRAPWSRVATNGADAALAQCLGMPTSDIGIVTGTTQPQGPPLVPSLWMTSGSTAGFFSQVALNQSASTVQSDMTALDKRDAASCLRGWFASLDLSGDRIVGVPTVVGFTPAVVAGERVSAFGVSVTESSGGATESVDEDLVILGAGRIEVAVVGEAVGESVDAPVEASLLSGVENRLLAEASS
jgi:hypothetical protein